MAYSASFWLRHTLHILVSRPIWKRQSSGRTCSRTPYSSTNGGCDQTWRERRTNGYATFGIFSRLCKSRDWENKVQPWPILCCVIRRFCAHKILSFKLIKILAGDSYTQWRSATEACRSSSPPLQAVNATPWWTKISKLGHCLLPHISFFRNVSFFSKAAFVFPQSGWMRFRVSIASVFLSLIVWGRLPNEWLL